MGAAARYLDVPGEQQLLGRGVSACATCDGFFFRDQDIAVVGGGDSAMEEATFLTRFARTVTVVHRRDEFRASKIMLERAKNDPKIRWRTNVEVTEVLGEGSVTGLRLRDTRTGEESTLDVTGMFVAIGHDPRSALVRGQVDTDDAGYVLTQAPSTHDRTSPACSPAATSSTTPTARPSPPPAPAARPRSTPSAGSPTARSTPSSRAAATAPPSDEVAGRRPTDHATSHSRETGDYHGQEHRRRHRRQLRARTS